MAIVECTMYDARLLDELRRIAREGLNPLTTPAHLEEVRETVERLKSVAGADKPVVEDTSAGMRIALTADAVGYHLSVSHPVHDAAEAARTLGGTEVACANQVTHFRLDGGQRPARLALSTASGAFAHAAASRVRPAAGIDDPHAYFMRRPSG